MASGKSNFGRLLCGLYEPTDGAMLIDGIDSREYRPQQLRDAFRYVGQDAAIFTGSVKDNLALGKREATDDRLIAALRATGAEPSPLHNNCSGKHSGMLSVALAMGVPTSGYVTREHAVQQVDALPAVADETAVRGGRAARAPQRPLRGDRHRHPRR